MFRLAMNFDRSFPFPLAFQTAVLLWKLYRRVSFSKHVLMDEEGLALALPPRTAASPFQRYFQSEVTGLWVYHRAWVPTSREPVRGVVYILHGFGEHCGRCVGHVGAGGGMVVGVRAVACRAPCGFPRRPCVSGCLWSVFEHTLWRVCELWRVC